MVGRSLPRFLYSIPKQLYYKKTGFLTARFPQFLSQFLIGCNIITNKLLKTDRTLPFRKIFPQRGRVL